MFRLQLYVGKTRMVDTQYIYNLLNDLHYPVAKDEILMHARLKGVGSDMEQLLLTLPYRTYESCRDVVRELPLQAFETRLYQYL